MLPGKLYELAIFTNTLINNPDKDFDLGQEIRIGDKFDDLVIRVNHNKYTFVQIKLVDGSEDNIIDTQVLLGEKKISLNKDDFKLQKYLLSHLRIKDQLNSGATTSVVHKLIIFTNADINEQDVKKQIGTVKILRGRNDNILNNNENATTESNINVNSIFIKKMRRNLKSDLQIVAEELARYVTDSNSNLDPMVLDIDCFRYYHTALFDEHVIEARDCQHGNKVIRLGKFTSNFIDGNGISHRAYRLRTRIIEIILEKQNNIEKLLEIMAKAEWKLSDDFGLTESKDVMFLPNYDISDKDVEDFFSILELRVNQHGVKDLLKKNKNEEMKNKFLEYFNTDPKLVEFLINDFIQGWRSEKTAQERWLLNSNRSEFIKELQIKIAKPQATHTTQKHVRYIESLIKKYNMHFHETCLFNKNDFLGKQKGKYFLISTASNILTSIKMIQYLNKTKHQNYIFIDLDSLSIKRQIIKLVDAIHDDNYNLLILSYKCLVEEDIINELFYKLSNTNKQVIFITAAVDSLIKRFSHYKEYKDRTIDIEHFVDDSKILQEKVTFQGQAMPIGDLCKIISPEVIDRLITSNIDIGGTTSEMNYLDGAYTNVFEEANIEPLVFKFTRKSSCIYIISGVPSLWNADRLIKEMGISDRLQANSIKKRVVVIEEDNLRAMKSTIYVTDDKFNDQEFKKICKFNPKYKIYWLHLRNEHNDCKFILAQIYNPKFYVQGHRFNKEISIKKNIKELLINQLHDFFLIFGATKKDIKSWLQLDNDEENLFEENCNKMIQFETGNEDLNIIFTDLVSENLNKTVHLLKFEQGRLIWFNTHGSLDSLSKYITRDYESNKLLSEDDIVEQMKDKKVLIIAGEPGIGKSTTFVKLYTSKSIITSHWVIRINLKDNIQLIRNIDFTNNHLFLDTLITEFLSQVDKSLNDDVVKSLLRIALMKEEFRKHLLLALDGFDEILDEKDRDIVILLLKHLKHKTRVKIWITTRLHYCNTLESNLSTFAIKLEAMDQDEVRTFVKIYLKENLALIVSQEEITDIFDNPYEYKDTGMLYKFTEAFLCKIKDIFKNDVSWFIGTPLQLYLMLEGSITYFKKWAREKSGDNLDFSYLGNNIWDAYEKFIERKYDIYLKKRVVKECVKQKLEKNVFDRFHRDLAKSLILGSELKKSFKGLKDIVLSAGIIRSDGINIDFIHSTFKEFYAANIIIHWIGKWIRERHNVLTNLQKKAFLCEDILSKPYYQVIRGFLNVKLLQKKLGHAYLLEEYYKKEVLLLAINENNVGVANFLLNNFQSASVDEPEHREDIFEKTPLESAVRSGNVEMLKLLIKHSVDINNLDELCSSLLHDAIKSGNLEIVKYLLENNADINTKGKCCEPVIYSAVAKSNNFNMVKFLIENGVDVSEHPTGGTALAIAAKYEDLETIKLLVHRGADVNGADRYGQRVICNAVARGDDNLEIVKFLVQNGAKINVKYRHGETLLSKAAGRTGNLELVKFLVQNGAAVNSRDDCGEIALNIAADLDIFKFLLQNGVSADSVSIKGFLSKAALRLVYGYSNFQINKFIAENATFNETKDKYSVTDVVAIGEGDFQTVKFFSPCDSINVRDSVDDICNFEIIKYVMENNLDVRSKNVEGKTVLDDVVKYGDLEMVKKFVINGADINSRDNHGMTVLHTAVSRPHNVHMIKFLVDNGADINNIDNYGDTVLYMAVARPGNLKAIQFLIKNGINIHSKNAEGKIALDIAVVYGNLEVVRLLVQHGADVNNRDNNNETVISRSVARRGNFDIIKYLVENGADIISDDTVLYNAAILGGDVKTLNYIMQNGANFRGENVEKVFCKAVEKGNLRIVKFLIEHGANINAKVSDDMTVLGYAVTRYNIDMVKCLMNNGADVNVRDNSGATVLHKAITFTGISGKHNYVRETLKVRSTDKNNVALFQGYHQHIELEIVKTLLKHSKLDVSIEDGLLLLKSASVFGKLKILKVLVQYIGTIGYLDNVSFSILSDAVGTNNREMVKFLMENMRINDERDGYMLFG